MASPSQPFVVSLAGLAKGTDYKPRPGTRYAIATDDDGAPTVVGIMAPPTDATVRAFDTIVRDNAKAAAKLQRLTRARMAAQQKASVAAVNGDQDALEAAEDALDSLDAQVQEFDPTNPDGAVYYVADWLRKADVAFDFFQVGPNGTLGDPVALAQVDGIQTRVVQAAVEDFRSLAFLSDGSRG